MSGADKTFSSDLTAAEFAFRSLAIEALEICRSSDISGVTVTVIPSEGEPDGFDWWKVSFSLPDGKYVQVSTCYGEQHAED